MSMIINQKTGVLAEADYQPSPNCDPRPEESDINLIVIHNISLPPGEFGGPYIQQLFTNALDPDEHPYFAEIHQLEVSAHLLIRRDGSLVQFVPFDQRAWHAGVSCYEGQERCNDFSIGIELEGTDDQAYEEIQYQQLGQVIETLLQTYPGLAKTRITGHCDIALGRKTDPGPAFDWNKLKTIINN